MFCALLSLCTTQLSEYWEILHSHISTAEDTSLVGCYALLLVEWFLMFRRTVVLSCLVGNSCLFLKLEAQLAVSFSSSWTQS